MKRVIVLSWLKKITNRLFGPDDDDQEYVKYENPENETDIVTEIDVPLTKPDRKNSASFRFPIISDAEIYGWDDEPTKERDFSKPSVRVEDEEEHYETRPLYENDKWPSDTRPVNVYRAETPLKYGAVTKDKKSSFSPAKKNQQEEIPPKPDKTVQKRSSKPFTPTAVPSPIYGYTTKRDTTGTSDAIGARLQSLKQRDDLLHKVERSTIVQPSTVTLVKDTDSEVIPELAIHAEVVPEMESAAEVEIRETPPGFIDHAEVVPEMESVAEVEIRETPPGFIDHAEEVPEMESAAEIEIRETPPGFIDHAEEVPEIESAAEIEIRETAPEVIVHAEKVPEIEFSAETGIREAAPDVDIYTEEVCLKEPTVEIECQEAALEVDIHSRDEFSEMEVEEAENDFLGIISDVEEHTENEFTELGTMTYTDIGETAIKQVPQKKSERIVPFNVLMLKSDKEKMKFDKPLKHQVAIENRTLKTAEPVQMDNFKHNSSENKKEAVEEIQEEEVYYAFPSLDYLIPPESQIEDTDWLESQSDKLEEALSHFAVKATVIEAVQGPTVTRFELTVGVGTKVSKVRNLTDDLKLALAAKDIRIEAPIPGRSSIGIEIPNRKTRAVRISEVIATEQFKTSTSPLEAVLGLSLTGKPVTLDLRKMPHGMIAGATGSGKSVCINSILVSLLYKASPTDLKMMLIDPKMVELAPFNGIPHLISPVITDVKAATAALKWAVAEMERRYELLAHAGVRDIERYNKAAVESRRFSMKMPYLLIVIDELADLMMMAPADVEVSISRIAQKARACGIHLIIATQRPSVDVITGTIKANIPTRIAFSVSSQIDSRTIIDSPGAERLLGKGDMLYIGNGQSSNVRLQGTFVTDEEIERIIEHVQNEASPEYLFGQDDLLASSIEEEGADSLFEEACLFIHETGSASTSLLQRNFSIGYNRAAKLIDRMEKNGFISGPRGSKARDVYLTESDLDRLADRLE